MLFIVACGDSATATTAPTAPAAGLPTAVPQDSATPQDVVATGVNPGKLTMMVGDLAAERFDDIYAPGATGGLAYLRLMGGYLISDNEKREMVPGIATKWGISSDGMTWSFSIRKGVKFHDGSELTPEDVLWSLRHYYGPQANEYLVFPSKYSEHSDRIELSGPDEVTWVFKKTFVELGRIFHEGPDGGNHIMPRRDELDDEQAAIDYDKTPIGAGPMRLASHTPGEVMRFERFDDFYYQPENGFPEDKRVNFQSLDLFLVPEEATRVAALRGGDADIAPASLAARETVEAGGGRLVFGQEGVVTDIRWVGCWEGGRTATEFPKCHDKRVRQALSYAIDRELIRDQLYGGSEVFGIKGWGFFTPSSSGYTPALDQFSIFDPDKARQLLSDAGYPGGQGFGMLIMHTAPSSTIPFNVEAAQLGAEFWRRELGLDVELRVSTRTAVKKAGRDGELTGQLTWLDNEPQIDPTSLVQAFYTDRRITLSKSSLHDEQELLDLAATAVAILDPEERAEAIRILLPRLMEEAYQPNIGYINIPWGVGPRVLTWQPNPMAPYPSALHTITLK